MQAVFAFFLWRVNKRLTLIESDREERRRPELTVSSGNIFLERELVYWNGLPALLVDFTVHNHGERSVSVGDLEVRATRPTSDPEAVDLKDVRPVIGKEYGGNVRLGETGVVRIEGLGGQQFVGKILVDDLADQPQFYSSWTLDVSPIPAQVENLDRAEELDEWDLRLPGHYRGVGYLENEDEDAEDET